MVLLQWSNDSLQVGQHCSSQLPLQLAEAAVAARAKPATQQPQQPAAVVPPLHVSQRRPRGQHPLNKTVTDLQRGLLVEADLEARMLHPHSKVVRPRLQGISVANYLAWLQHMRCSHQQEP